VFEFLNGQHLVRPHSPLIASWKSLLDPFADGGGPETLGG